MNRREYLLGLVTGFSGLAGCTGESAPDASAGATPTETSTTSEALTVDATVETDGSTSPLSLSAETVRETVTATTPARIRLTVQNTGDAPRTYGTGAPLPFGVLSVDDTLLWTDEYVKSTHVETEGRRVIGGEDIGLQVTLEPGEQRSDTYDFRAPPGTYTTDEGELQLDDVQYELQLSVQ